MKGLAPPDTLTGKIQRALTDEWESQWTIASRIGPLGERTSNVRACLDRLVTEGRAAKLSAGGVNRWRKPTGEARTSQRVAGTADPLGDDGNAGTPVVPMEPNDG